MVSRIRIFSCLMLVMMWLTSMAQTGPTFISLNSLPSPARPNKNTHPLTFYPGTYIDSESLYTDSTGMSVIIQNSYPKGSGYTDPTGKKFGCIIVWARVVNQTDSTLAMSIEFPATPLELSDSYPKIGSAASPTRPSSYLHLFLPPDTMNLSKESLYNYGMTGLEEFLDHGLNDQTMLQSTIGPRRDTQFYIGALFYQTTGKIRAELALKGQQLFYRITGVSVVIDDMWIPCGRVVFKN